MTRQETVKAYRQSGLELTPLRDKRPYLTGWPTLDYTDEKWEKFHGSQGTDFGMILGERSQNIVCVDIDPRNGGDTWYKANQEKLDAECAVIEESWRGDGGRHLFFLDKSGKFQRSCKLAEGIDYLAKGKQVVLAPSIHPDTDKPYFAVKGDLSLWQYVLTDIPRWLRSILEEAGADRVKEDQRPFDLPTEISDGDRAQLIRSIEGMTATKSSRHDKMGEWITNAVSCAMPTEEIHSLAKDWIQRQGRDEYTGHEIMDWITHAERSVAQQTAHITSRSLLPERYIAKEGDEDPNKFRPVMEEGEEDPNGWKEHLRWTYSTKMKADIVKDSLYNVQMYLEHHPALGKRLAFNEMTMTSIKYGKETYPWDSPADKYTSNCSVTDQDTAQIRSWLSGSAEGPAWEVSDSVLSTAVLAASLKNKIHPIRDWLYGVEWDGEERLSKWLNIVTNCGESSYLDRMSEIIILSSTARIMHPGTKWDNCIILEGKQGNGKSTLCEMIAGGAEAFCDTIGDLRDNKVSVERAEGALVVELPEIEQFFNRFSSSVLKNWLSVKVDKCRMSYGKTARSVPRSYIVIGTTNKSEYLTDSTGERRYFPIKTRPEFFNLKYFKSNRDQIFAEARDRIRKQGVNKALEISKTTISEQEEVQKDRTYHDSWSDAVIVYTDKLKDDAFFRISDLLSSGVGVSLAKQSPADHTRVTKILTYLGFIQKQRLVDGMSGRQRVWIRENPRKVK